MLPFAATLLIAFGLALGPGRTLLEETTPALLWLAVLFAAVLLLRGAYESEGEDRALEGLLLAPVDKAAVFLGKACAVVLELFALEAVVVLMVTALFSVSLGNGAALAGSFALGSVGLAAVGSLFGVLAESARAREAVFPLLVVPLTIPVLIAGIKAVGLSQAGQGAEAGSWLALLFVFDLVFVAAGALLFGELLED